MDGAWKEALAGGVAGLIVLAGASTAGGGRPPTAGGSA